MHRMCSYGMTLAFFLAGLPVPARGADRRESFLKYQLNVTGTEEFGGGQDLQLATAKGSDEVFDLFHSLPRRKDEPHYRGEPLYAALRLGMKNEQVFVVLDNSAGTKLGYDTLYVDANRDGRITHAVKVMAGERRRGTVFGPVARARARLSFARNTRSG
jgi:hypothetical protein